VEVKNVLGAKNVERAIEYEYQRHKSVYESGREVDKETRRFDAPNGKTISMRGKEEDPDYRFF